MAAGFGLPPGIHDGAAGVAHYLVVPVPGLRVDRLPHGTQQAQAGTGTALDRFVAQRVQGADGRWRGIEGIDLVFVHDFPAAPGVGVRGHALEHQRDSPVGQGAVDDVRVPRHPAHIGGAPVDLALAIVEYVLEGHGRLQQVAPRGVEYALGLAGGAGRVENEQGVFRVHGFRRAFAGGGARRLVIPDIPVGLPGHVGARAAHHQAGVDIGAGLECLVGVHFQGNCPAATHAFVRGDQSLAIGIQYAVFQRLRRKAAKHHRMDGADAGAGQHGVCRFGNHRHIDANAVAPAYPARLECVGEPADLVLELGVGDVPAVRGVITLPDEGSLAGPLRQVPVYAVVADIELAAGEPFGLALDEVVAGHLVPGFVPGQELARHVAPEAFAVVD